MVVVVAVVAPRGVDVLGASVVVVVVLDDVYFGRAMTKRTIRPGLFRNLRNFPVSFFVSSDTSSAICLSSSSVDFAGMSCF